MMYLNVEDDCFGAAGLGEPDDSFLEDVKVFPMLANDKTCTHSKHDKQEKNKRKYYGIRLDKAI